MTTQLRSLQLTPLLLLLITASTTYAQWTGTSATSATDNATRLGNVGIGISSTPAGELHLKAIGSTNTWADMKFESTAGKQWSLSARDDRFVLTNWSNATTSSDYLTILNSNGDVGIGTISPVSDLDVRGGGRITCDALYFYGGTAGTGTDNLPNVRIEDSYGMRFRANNDGHYVFSSQTSIVVGTAIQPNGTDFGVGNIVASGKIGIGKIPGVALLDIADYTTAGIALVNIGNDAFLTDVDIPNILGIYGQANNASGGIELGSSGPTLFGSSAGYLGIGTTTPGTLLHVAGGDLRVDGRIAIGGNMNTLAGVALSVNGSIYSKATYVTVNGWPDDIFDSEYQLKGLDEVEDYIKKHKHLPSIPSEKEIMEKGLDTGEMLKLQMAKIEELTLYLIAQQKSLEKQQKEIEGLKEEIKAVKSK